MTIQNVERCLAVAPLGPRVPPLPHGRQTKPPRLFCQTASNWVTAHMRHWGWGWGTGSLQKRERGFLTRFCSGHQRHSGEGQLQCPPSWATARAYLVRPKRRHQQQLVPAPGLRTDPKTSLLRAPRMPARAGQRVPPQGPEGRGTPLQAPGLFHSGVPLRGSTGHPLCVTSALP